VGPRLRSQPCAGIGSSTPTDSAQRTHVKTLRSKLLLQTLRIGHGEPYRHFFMLIKARKRRLRKPCLEEICEKAREARSWEAACCTSCNSRSKGFGLSELPMPEGAKWGQSHFDRTKACSCRMGLQNNWKIAIWSYSAANSSFPATLSIQLNITL
jgi:hypothetical protein